MAKHFSRCFALFSHSFRTYFTKNSHSFVMINYCFSQLAMFHHSFSWHAVDFLHIVFSRLGTSVTKYENTHKYIDNRLYERFSDIAPVYWPVTSVYQSLYCRYCVLNDEKKNNFSPNIEPGDYFLLFFPTVST